MTTQQQQRINYYYRGQIERGPKYTWTEGWSANSEDGLPLYPWSTKRECRAEAKKVDARAIFIYDERHRIA